MKLCKACVDGDVETVRVCMNQYADEADRARLVATEVEVEGVGDGPAFPLAFASWCGRGDVVLALLDEFGADVNQQSFLCGDVALGSAVYENHYDIVVMLLSHGADPNLARTTDGETPLFYAGDARVAKALIAHGADTTMTNSTLMTAAHAAIDRDAFDVLEAILLARPSTQLYVHMRFT